MSKFTSAADRNLIKRIDDACAQIETAKAAWFDRSVELGKLLGEAKQRHPKVADFEAFLKETKVGINMRWAYECIAMAGDPKEAERLRQANKERVERHREKKRLNKPEPEHKKTSCDIDWNNPDPEDFASSAEMFAMQADNYAHEATHLAKAYPLLNNRYVDPATITEARIQDVQSLADAWSGVVSQLTKHMDPSEPGPKAINLDELRFMKFRSEFLKIIDRACRETKTRWKDGTTAAEAVVGFTPYVERQMEEVREFLRKAIADNQRYNKGKNKAA